MHLAEDETRMRGIFVLVYVHIVYAWSRGKKFSGKKDVFSLLSQTHFRKKEEFLEKFLPHKMLLQYF